MNKKITLLILAIILSFLLRVWWLSSRFHPILGFGVGSEDKVIVGEITNQRIRQTFVAPANGLRRIYLTAVKYQSKNKGKLAVRLLSLENGQEKIIQERKFEDARIEDNQWLFLEFPSITNSKGKKFALELLAEDPIHGTALTFWRAPTDIYEEGELYYNDSSGEGDLLFSAFYQLPESYLEIFVTSFKEKITNDPSFFTVYFLIILGTLFLLIRLLFLKEE